MRSSEKQPKQFEGVIAIGQNRNKVYIAVALLSVMALMWGRVLLQKKPAAAAANETATNTDTSKTQDQASSVSIKYIMLPRIKGRHDVLGRDLFSSKGWQKDDNGEAKTKTGQEIIKEQGDEIVAKVQMNVKLEAISSGTNPKAFINGVLLEKGGRLVVKVDGSKYEVEVKAITEGEVVLAVNGMNFTVAMSKAVETTD